MDNIISYKTSSPAGDLISFLAGVRKMYHDTGKRGVIYQRLGMVGIGYPDSIHPYQNSEGEPIAMAKEVFGMLYPLIKSQEYIKDFLEFRGEEVDFDFDLIRLERFCNQPSGCLNRWYNFVFPQMASDLSEKYIELPKEQPTGKILINFTQRYRNHIIHYHFLKKHQDKIIFAGLKKERDLFCEQWDLDIPLLEVKNFLELANVINNSVFFMGNASMCYQIAEGLKVPRILESFPRMPNVIPQGKGGYDFYGQSQLEYYFNQLVNAN